ncbi:MAG TPA: glycosyltransferase [Chloroflexi bacterium]|nr:glycosyltransferase [Chloroflexota bacterium]
MDVAIVIPALNEEDSLPTVLSGLPEGLLEKTVVVDNGSSDRTAEVAEAAGAQVVREQRRGYGYACAAGAAAAGSADVLVFLDGDGSDDPRQIASVLQPMERDEADLVLGARTIDPEAEGALMPHQRLGNAMVTGLVRLLYGQRVNDLPPLKAIRAPVLRSLDMKEMTYGWTVEMIVKCLRQGYRVVEVPATVGRRLGGRSKVSGTARGTVLAAYHLVGTTLRCADGRVSPDLSAVAKELPRELYVEVTNRCNSRCLTCIRTYRTLEPVRDLEFGEFKRIIDQFPTLDRVVLHGIGEPLLNEELPRMIRYVKGLHHGAHVLFNSNAMLLDQRWQRELADAGLDELRISLDAASPETYEAIRGVDGFASVEGNLRRYSALTSSGHAPRPSLWFTASRANIEELPDLVDLAAEVGIPEVHVQRLVLFDEGLARLEQSLNGRLGPEAEAILGDASKRADTLGVSLSASGLVSPQESLREARPESRPWSSCRRPWTTIYITANGNVLPCCISPFAATDYAGLVAGNAFHAPIASVWNGAKYVDRRAAMRTADPVHPCERCGVYWSL